MSFATRIRSEQRGFTLVEVSILLAVLVILSAVISPVLSRSVAETRLSAAKAELAAISQSLRQFLEDIGCEIVPQNQGDGSYRRAAAVQAPYTPPPSAPPVGGPSAEMATASGAWATICGSSGICSSDPVELLVSSGDIPALGPDGDERWVRPPDGGDVDFLEYYLISNTPGNTSSRRFPTPEDCADPLSSLFDEVQAWRGAYLNVGHGDPWGNRYMINTVFLSGRSVEDVVVLSAGPDQEVDSDFAVDGFVPDDDDVALLFSTGH